jgi:hypothetical protein
MVSLAKEGICGNAAAGAKRKRDSAQHQEWSLTNHVEV